MPTTEGDRIMRYVWIGAGVLVAIVAVVLIVGYSLPVKHRATAERTVNASPETVFALITDVPGLAAWRDGVKSAEVIPSTDGRKRFREISGDGTITYLVEAIEPNRRLVTRIDDKTLPFGGT